MTPEDVQKRAGKRLIVCSDLDALHRQMAEDIAEDIRNANQQDTPLCLILPAGPTGQYPFLTEIINSEGLNLSRCWFFFMDEYCDQQGKALDADHPLSFKGIARQLLIDQLESHTHLNQSQIIFPDENNISTLSAQIEMVGGIDTCYGGIGIHGHIAFNEPEAGVSRLGCRRVRLNDFTITINTVRSRVGGNLEGFPKSAYTLGMREILSARQIRLYCRNGSEFDWANTVLRLALFGTPGDDYPVTTIRDTNYVIITDEDTLASPKIIL